MANLVHFLVELANDPDSRRRFLEAPDEAVATLGSGLDGGLTGEDVAAAIDVACRRVDDEVRARVLDAQQPAIGLGQDPIEAALDQLRWLCAVVDPDGDLAAAEGPSGASTGATDDGPDGSAEAEQPVRVLDRGDAGVVAAGGGDALPSQPPGTVADGGGEALSPYPPGMSTPRLWAVAQDDADGPAVDPDHPAAGGRTSLSPVPEPEGGFVASVLEIVELPDGHEPAGLEPGTRGTVVAVHHDPELLYELEVEDEDGPRFVIVPHAATRVVS